MDLCTSNLPGEKTLDCDFANWNHDNSLCYRFNGVCSLNAPNSNTKVHSFQRHEPAADGESCSDDYDCANNACDGGICVSCFDGIENQNEGI